MNQEPARTEGQSVQKKKMNGCLLATIIIVIVAVLATGGCVLLGGAALFGSVKQYAAEESGKLQSLGSATPSDLQPTGELASHFNLNSDHTDLQRDNKEKEIKGKIVDWTLTVYEIKKSGENYRIQTETRIGGYGNEVAAFVEVTASNPHEKSLVESLKTGDRFRFKGYIDGVWMRSLNIKPAILVDADSTSSTNVGTTPAERKVAQMLEHGERQLNQEVEEAFAIGNAIRAAKDASAENPMPKITINDISPGGPSTVDPNNSVIDHARQELELEKIKLERERIELERERLKMHNQSNATPKTNEAKNEDGEVFVTFITKNDIYNSNGVRISDPVLILMQDRANVHRFGNPDGDQVDRFFKEADHRAKIRSYLERGSFPQDVKNSILSGSGQKFRVVIYKNNEGKDCVDVGFQSDPKDTSSITEDRPGLDGKVEGRHSASVDLYEITDSESNIREGPGTNYPIIRKSSKGEVGEHQSVKMGWMKLQFADGSMGWVHEQNVKSKN